MKSFAYNIENIPAPQSMQRLGIISEWKALFQIGRLLLHYKRLVKQKQGNKQRIILFPGFRSSESSIYPIKHFLTRIGYAPEYWGLGLNNGDVEAGRDLMIQKLTTGKQEEKVDLVGWSLGGVIAREVARSIPKKINSLFIFGSPIKGPKYTVGAEIYDAVETQRITTLLETLEASKPCLLYTSPSPRDQRGTRMPSSA